MREDIQKILGKYKIIGDTTYGIGYEEAQKLIDEIISEVIGVISTHSEHCGDYCDTGEDMEWSCRSECVDMAIKRLKE